MKTRILRTRRIFRKLCTYVRTTKLQDVRAENTEVLVKENIVSLSLTLWFYVGTSRIRICNGKRIYDSRKSVKNLQRWLQCIDYF